MPRTVSIQGKIDIFETPDQVEHLAARDWSPGSNAKVRAAAEWSIVINQTIAGDRFEHRTSTDRIFRERFPTGGA